MRLGAQPVDLAEGTRATARLRRAGRPRAPPAPLRGEQPLPAAARRGRARRLGDVPGGPARGDHRAPRPPVVRREPVPSGVQVAPDPAGAALPRLRRRGARARPATSRSTASARRRAVASGALADLDPEHPRRAGSARASACRAAEVRRRATPRRQPLLESAAMALSRRPRPLPRARCDPEPAGRGARGRRSCRRYLGDLGLAVPEDDAGADDRVDIGNLLARLEATNGAGVPIFLCAHLDTVPPTDADRAGRRGGRRAERERTRSSGPTTRPPSRSCSRPRGGSSPSSGRTPGSSFSSRRRRRPGSRAPRRSTTRRLAARHGLRLRPRGPDRRRRRRRLRTRRPIDVVFKGRAAHAGMHPEEGRSAIAGRRAGDRRPPARPDRRRDDRERRRDRGRHGAQHRPRPLHGRGRGSLAERAEARGASSRRC